MKISSSERILYRHNPLAEVICQIRFTEREAIDGSQREQFAAAMRDLGCEKFSTDVSMSLKKDVIPMAVRGDSADVHQSPFEERTTYRFESEDGYKVSLERQFIALSCTKYTQWADFQSRMIAVANSFNKIFGSVELVRLGLRYRDIVEREPLGLTGVPWHELIKDFLLGPLAPNALADGQYADESKVESFLSQTNLTLDNASVLLQSGLLTSIDKQRRAFLIDADFFNENELEVSLLEDEKRLVDQLNILHANSGNLFRRGITERLDNALR